MVQSHIELLVNAAVEHRQLGQLLVLKGPPCRDGYHHLERFDDLSHPGRVLQGELVGYHMTAQEAVAYMRSDGLQQGAKDIIDYHVKHPAEDIRLLYVTSGSPDHARIIGVDDSGYQMLLWDLDSLAGLST